MWLLLSVLCIGRHTYCAFIDTGEHWTNTLFRSLLLSVVPNIENLVQKKHLPPLFVDTAHDTVIHLSGLLQSLHINQWEKYPQSRPDSSATTPACTEEHKVHTSSTGAGLTMSEWDQLAEAAVSIEPD